MYASEKYVRAEVKALRETLQAISSDLGGDIITLHEMLLEIKQQQQELINQLKSLDETNV
jgi:hypothetical protein